MLQYIYMSLVMPRPGQSAVAHGYFVPDLMAETYAEYSRLQADLPFRRTVVTDLLLNQMLDDGSHMFAPNAAYCLGVLADEARSYDPDINYVRLDSNATKVVRPHKDAVPEVPALTVAVLLRGVDTYTLGGHLPIADGPVFGKVSQDTVVAGGLLLLNNQRKLTTLRPTHAAHSVGMEPSFRLIFDFVRGRDLVNNNRYR